jgi:hypothetical protein
MHAWAGLLEHMELGPSSSENVGYVRQIPLRYGAAMQIRHLTRPAVGRGLIVAHLRQVRSATTTSPAALPKAAQSNPGEQLTRSTAPLLWERTSWELIGRREGVDDPVPPAVRVGHEQFGSPWKVNRTRSVAGAGEGSDAFRCIQDRTVLGSGHARVQLLGRVASALVVEFR